MAKEVILPSGSKLEITEAPFREAKRLYMAVASELKGLKVEVKTDLDVNFFKDIICAALDSEKIDVALEECLKRCTYNGKRIMKLEETFESVESRGDYIPVCWEVAKENLIPFTKDLFAGYREEFQNLLSALK